jgi:protein-tyrosine phosphatase
MYGIDDGSESLKDSIQILKNAYANGITDIVLTPHYVNRSTYKCNNENKKKILEELKHELEKENININLYLGNEVMLDIDILDLIKNDEVSTINNTKYILIEFPMRNEDQSAEKVVFDLIRNGYIPIIAHPERYEYFKDHPEKIDKFIEMGALFQGNYLSLLGRYGDRAKKLLKMYLKERKIVILASDVHRPSTDLKVKKATKRLKWLIKDKKYQEELLEKNFLKIINNETIDF